eukprot:m.257772 g.257772  ORF g.257772 m.257772 type:complete len:802 (-) comp22711_c1_seq7:33-2438(-)
MLLADRLRLCCSQNNREAFEALLSFEGHITALHSRSETLCVEPGVDPELMLQFAERITQFFFHDQRHPCFLAVLTAMLDVPDFQETMPKVKIVEQILQHLDFKKKTTIRLVELLWSLSQGGRDLCAYLHSNNVFAVCMQCLGIEDLVSLASKIMENMLQSLPGCVDSVPVDVLTKAVMQLFDMKSARIAAFDLGGQLCNCNPTVARTLFDYGFLNRCADAIRKRAPERQQATYAIMILLSDFTSELQSRVASRCLELDLLDMHINLLETETDLPYKVKVAYVLQNFATSTVCSEPLMHNIPRFVAQLRKHSASDPVLRKSLLGVLCNVVHVAGQAGLARAAGDNLYKPVEAVMLEVICEGHVFLHSSAPAAARTRDATQRTDPMASAASRPMRRIRSDGDSDPGTPPPTLQHTNRHNHSNNRHHHSSSGRGGGGGGERASTPHFAETSDGTCSSYDMQDDDQDRARYPSSDEEHHVEAVRVVNSASDGDDAYPSDYEDEEQGLHILDDNYASDDEERLRQLLATHPTAPRQLTPPATPANSMTSARRLTVCDSGSSSSRNSSRNSGSNSSSNSSNSSGTGAQGAVGWDGLQRECVALATLCLCVLLGRNGTLERPSARQDPDLRPLRSLHRALRVYHTNLVVDCLHHAVDETVFLGLSWPVWMPLSALANLAQLPLHAKHMADRTTLALICRLVVHADVRVQEAACRALANLACWLDLRLLLPQLPGVLRSVQDPAANQNVQLRRLAARITQNLQLTQASMSLPAPLAAVSAIVTHALPITLHGVPALAQLLWSVAARHRA